MRTKNWRSWRSASTEVEEELKVLLLPKDPNDEKNVILEIRAGTGGDEATLFAAEMFRMYSRYAERNRWKVEVLSTSESGVGGLKEVIAIIEGQGVYSRLKYESGVHRVQRVPQTETQGRVHTSAVTVAVLPEAEDVDVKIEAKDIRIDTFCSSGPGGQSVNTTYSAVRITHLPTNTVVSCQDEKSQIKNREKGMRVLRARLYEMEQQKQQDALAKERKAMVGSGDRSEKIRTYNFPQNRVTDHRIGFTAHQLPEFMDGKLQPMIDALITHFQSEKLKQESRAGVGFANRQQPLESLRATQASARVGGRSARDCRLRLASPERRDAADVRARRQSRLSLRSSRTRADCRRTSALRRGHRAALDGRPVAVHHRPSGVLGTGLRGLASSADSAAGDGAPG